MSAEGAVLLFGVDFLIAGGCGIIALKAGASAHAAQWAGIGVLLGLLAIQIAAMLWVRNLSDRARAVNVQGQGEDEEGGDTAQVEGIHS